MTPLFFDRRDVMWRLLEELGLRTRAGSVLSIGAGEGVLELELARELGSDIGYIDPDPELSAVFEARLDQSGLEARVVERHFGPFQTYVPCRRYELVIAVSSWFHMGFDPSMLRRALDVLEPGGALLIVITSERDIFRLMLERQPSVVAERLSEWAKREGYRHQFGVTAARYHHDRFMDGPRPSQEALELVRFVAFDTAWDDLSSHERDRLVAVFEACQERGYIERHVGYLLFAADE